MSIIEKLGVENIFYLESLLLCLVILVVLFIANLRYWRPLIINRLSLIYFFVALTIISYAGWAIVDGHPSYAWANKILTISSATFMTLTCMFYYYYVLKQVGITFKNGKFWYISSFFAIVGSFVLNIVSLWTGLTFIIDENGHYQRGLLFFIDLAASYSYVVCGVGFAVAKALKADNLNERHKYSTIALAIIPTVVLGVINNLLPFPYGLPTVFYGIIVSLFIVYSSSSAVRVTRDGLTGLLNRFAFDKLLSQTIAKSNRNDNSSLFLVMIDINGFKAINDTFGHAVGDEVLIKLAAALEKVSKDFDAPIGRWGGDEFIAFIETKADIRAQMFIETLKSRVTADCNDDNRFKVSISAGMAKLREYESMKHLFEEADHKLYEDKAKYHRRDSNKAK
jgi:diguanylate cyclase (GGDEF)-like protein